MKRWVGMLFVGLSLACGLLVPEDLTESARRDEYSGFVEGGAIQVCFDGVPLISPALAKEGPLSICMDRQGDERRCGPGAGCGSGERCICGLCSTRPCRSATECEGGEVCQSNRCTKSCGDNRKCGEGERCEAGACVRPCMSHGQCAHGERCSTFDGTCVVKLCGEQVGCGGSEVCVARQVVADVREPTVVSFDEGEVAYVEVRGGPAYPNACAVYRVRVQEMNRWVIEPSTPVLVPREGDGGCLGGPSVLRGGGGVVMVASRGDGSGIVKATSRDGVNFDSDAGVMLEPALQWERGWVGAPALVAWRGKWLMLYEAGRGAGIGIANVSESGVVRHSNEPWLVPSHFEDPSVWRDVQRIGSPYGIEREGKLWVYLTVRGVEGLDAVSRQGQRYAADSNDSIGLAVSRDGKDTEVFLAGPVFARRTNLRAYLGEAEPSVVFSKSGSWLVFASSDASGEARVGLGYASTFPRNGEKGK